MGGTVHTAAAPKAGMQTCRDCGFILTDNVSQKHFDAEGETSLAYFALGSLVSVRPGCQVVRNEPADDEVMCSALDPTTKPGGE